MATVDNIHVKNIKLATKLFLNVFARRDSEVFQFMTNAKVEINYLTFNNFNFKYF